MQHGCVQPTLLQLDNCLAASAAYSHICYLSSSLSASYQQAGQAFVYECFWIVCTLATPSDMILILIR